MNDIRPYAEDLPYWKTSQSSPDKWLDKAATEIERAGGEIISEGYGRNGGKSAYMLRFSLDDDIFRLVWPVLESCKGQDMAARRQAATMLFHDVKSSCIKARALGARVAFFAHLELPNGSVAAELSNPALGRLPELMGQRLLEGEVTDDD